MLLLQGIARATEEAGLALLVLPERGDGVQDAVVDAFCLYSLPAGHPDVVAAQERGLPLVVVDGPRLAGHAYVGSEDRRGARLAAEHLLELGHRRFAVLTERSDGDRLRGYRDALAAAGADWVEVAALRAVRRPAADGGDRRHRPTRARRARGRPACACRRTSRSSASTTSPPPPGPD